MIARTSLPPRYADALMVIPWELAVIDEEHGFTDRLSTTSFAENSGHCRWFIRLTIRGMRTNIEYGGNCESTHSSLRPCETLQAR
jgi:hypothetical protein